MILFVVAAVIVEGMAWLALQVVGPRLNEPIQRTSTIYAEQAAGMRRLLDSNGTGLGELDSVLGWHYRAGYVGGLHRITAQGLRGHRLYAATPPAGVMRVAAFGDSFVYGAEVPSDEAWAVKVESLVPTVELLNYGVGGYGVDQAYLRFVREGMALKPRLVAMGFVEDDLSRIVNVYRRFRSVREDPIAKPRYLLADSGQLTLLATPLGRPADFAPYLERPARIRALGEHDYWYSRWIYANPLYDWSATVRLASALWVRVRHRYLDHDRLMVGGRLNPASSAFKIQRRLFERFAQDVRAAGATPVFIFFADRASVALARSGAPTVYAPLMDSVCARATPCLDTATPFVAAPAGAAVPGWFMPGGHYSASANRLVAEWIGPRLRALAASAP